MPRISTPQEIFDAMPARFQPEQAGDMNAVVQFDLSGEGGGQWYATIKDGRLNVEQGTTPQPNVTLTTSAADYVAMINGELNPMNAFMQGRVKVKGDMGLLMRMQGLFSRG